MQLTIHRKGTWATNTSMARTRQTARNSVGGRAPNRRLPRNHPLGQGVILPLPLPSPQGQQRNQVLDLAAELRGYFNKVYLKLDANLLFPFSHYIMFILILQDLQDVHTPPLTDKQVDQWNHVRNLQSLKPSLQMKVLQVNSLSEGCNKNSF